MDACEDGWVEGQNEANAHLIAAAPDMLAALDDLVSHADDTSLCFNVVIRHGDFEQARAAIAKALGQK